jgi:type VI protein secretion system component VasK
MFSFRSDKTGFFVTIILLVLLGAAVVSTLVVLLLGHWDEHVWILKWVWGTWWVLCIITVLTRLAIFRWQMMRSANRAPRPQEQETPKDKEPSSSS